MKDVLLSGPFKIMKKQKRSSKGSRMTYLAQLKEHNAKSKKIINGISQDAIDSIAIAIDAVKALNAEGLSPPQSLQDKVRSLARLTGFELVESNNTSRRQKKKLPAKRGRGRPKGSKNKPKKKVAKPKVKKKASKKSAKKKAPAKRVVDRPKGSENKPKKKKS